MADKIQKTDRATVRLFYSLIQSAVLDQPLITESKCPNLDIIFHYAQLNSVSGLLYYAIYKNNLPLSDQLIERWKKELYETIYYNLSLKEYWKDLRQELDRLDIQYIPIKGAVIQDYYPKPGMRSMSDYDIIYRYRNEENRGLYSESLQKLKSLNAREDICITADGGIVDSLYMGNHILFEMHREFLGSDQKGHEYYHRIWDLCIPTKNPHEFQLSDSEQFILMLVHSHKHYSSAGCGPKELVDYYVVKHSSCMTLDWTYIYEILNRFSLLPYEKLLDRLTQVIFENVPGTEEDWIELEKWFAAGTYGNDQRWIAQQISEYTSQGDSVLKAKLTYLTRRLYPSRKFVKDQFPFFYSHRILMPLLPMYRIIRGRKGLMKKIRGELALLCRDNSKKAKK